MAQHVATSTAGLVSIVDASRAIMKRLTQKDDWSPDYETDDVARRLDDIEQFYRANKNIRDLWDFVLLPILREAGARSAVEIGSAPGQNLVELAKGLAVTPFGIEYTEEGARLNRQLFLRNSISPDNVHCEDFFSPAIDALRGSFDVALSFGFVEHFDDPIIVIKRQIDLCRTGGYVVIVIPNLQGLYYWWNRFFNPHVIETHNIAMMKDNAFFKMCESIGNLQVVFRGLVGAFDYGLLTHRGQFMARAGITLLRQGAAAAQVLDRHVLAKIGLGHAPYMVVVGKKLS
jgi:SAM-dependent methyltransferase